MGTGVRLMAGKESPLADLAATDGVRMVCVLGPDGRILSSLPNAREDSSWFGFLQTWMNHPFLSRPELKEIAIFYPRFLLLWRRIGQNTDPSGEAPSLEEASYRNLFLVAEPATSLSLLRVSLDVKEHGWRALGVQKVFPSSGANASEGSIFSKLFKRPGH